MNIGKLTIKTTRWGNWSKDKSSWTAFMGRFGGGWNYSLGIRQGGNTILIDLMFGSIVLTWKEIDGTN